MINKFSKTIYKLQRENNPYRQVAITFSYLGKLGLTNYWNLQECKNHLQNLLLQSLKQSSITEFPLIIGLTESGIIPSALMYENAKEKRINAQWLCSTRRVAHGIDFSESHSHAPKHILPFPEYQPTEFWFVEDEITTGRTLLNLTLRLCPLLNVKYVRFFALADTRHLRQMTQFKSILTSFNIQFSTHSLIRLAPTEPDNTNDLFQTRTNQTNEININKEHFFNQKNTSKHQEFHDYKIFKELKGSLLIIGEAIHMAIKIIKINPLLSFQNITLSPWQIDGKSVLSKLEFSRKYYLYNYHQIKSPIYILSDLEDKDIELEAEDILLQKGLNVKSIKSNTINTNI